MAYRQLEARVIVADDSNLSNKDFDRAAFIFKSLDLEAQPSRVRIGPADSEATMSLGTVTNGKFIAVFSDYPVRIRVNGAAATQYVQSVQSVAPVNTGAPAPPMCCFIATVNVTELRFQPIVGATQTATVWWVVTGDPQTDYSA